MSVLTQGTIISLGETKCRGLGEGGAGGGWWAMCRAVGLPGGLAAWGAVAGQRGGNASAFYLWRPEL